MRAPEAPIGWPSAQAPPWMFTLSAGRSRSRSVGHGDDGERFVDFVEIDFLLRSTRFLRTIYCMAPTGAVGNRAGASAWVVWPTMRAIGCRPSLVSLRCAHQQQGGGAIGNRRRIGRRHRAVLPERRLQSRDLFDVDRERAFVLVDDGIAMAAG